MRIQILHILSDLQVNLENNVLLSIGLVFDGSIIHQGSRNL